MTRQQKASAKRARRAERPAGFSNYAVTNTDRLRQERVAAKAEALHQKKLEAQAAREKLAQERLQRAQARAKAIQDVDH